MALNGKAIYSQMLPDGRLMINTTATNIPKDFWNVVYMNYTNAVIFNNYIYTIAKGKIVRINIAGK